MTVDRHAHRPWDGTPADLDAERADACRCGPEYFQRGLIAPDCQADSIFDLCDQLDQQTARIAALADVLDAARDVAEALADILAVLDPDR